MRSCLAGIAILSSNNNLVYSNILSACTYILITNKYIEIYCYYFKLKTNDNFHRKKRE